MPEQSTITTLAEGVGNLARDAAYVAVGLGVLGFQRIQVQRVELMNKLDTDFALDERLSGVRQEVTKGVKHLDDLVESAAKFLETSFQPLEEQLPPTVTQVTTKAFDQAREVRSTVRQRVLSN